MNKVLFFLSFLTISSSALSASLINRLGIGFSDHLVNDMQTISLKLQNSKTSAFGGNFGLDTSEDGTFYAIGLKYYHLIYEEPQLNFYSTLGGNIFTYQDQAKPDDTQSGYQIDGLFGAEFSFQGLESLGFSFEFGVSLYKFQETTHTEITGNNFLKSAIHFYL